DLIYEFSAPGRLDNADRDDLPVPSSIGIYSQHSANFLQGHGHCLNVLVVEYAAFQVRSNRHRFSLIACAACSLHSAARFYIAFGAQTNQRLIAQAIENMIDIATST